MGVGGITGLLAGIGIVIAVAKEIDWGTGEYFALGALGLVVAIIGGVLAGAAASGCLRAEE
jgi:hypothetical protein